MDQETPKGPDKRNWRERLGIGTTGPAGTPGKDLPRIGEDYRKVTPAPIAPRVASPSAPRTSAPPAPRAPVPRATAPKVDVKVAPAVRPAPMAPRPAAKVAPVRPTAPAVSPEKLAERLRAQRDASEKFAEQRIQVAKQRAEQAQQPAAPPPPPPKQVAGNSKPKFSFAEEDAAPAPAPVVQQRTIAPPVQAPQTPVNVAPPLAPPQMAPARPPLGATPGGYQQQRVQQPFQQQPNLQQPYFPPQQQPYGNNGYVQPNYRPIDPATGYPVQPQQYGQQPYGAPPQQRPYGAPGGNFQQASPRLGMPPVGMPGGMQPRPGLNPNYVPQGELGVGIPQGGNPGFGLDARNSGPALSPMRSNRQPNRTPVNPEPALYNDEPNDELFEEAAPRAPRRAATDYQQAYREAEAGYEDPPANKGPWILLGLLLLSALAAMALIWYYSSTIKPLISQSTSDQQSLPVVEAPDTAAKVAAPERSLTPATPGTPTKKQIYDRIVGDREVLKGDVVPTEEVPLAPLDAATPPPDPAAPATDAGATPIPAPATDSADPLPIPAPPGDPSPQGSLEDDPSKQSAEIVTPAAGESQAAVVASPPLVEPKSVTPLASETPPDQQAVASLDTKTPDVPDVSDATASADAPKPAVESESIGDTPETAGLPSPKLRKFEPTPKPKKVVPKKEAEKVLGSKPVVLVPISKQLPKKQPKIAKQNTPADSTGDSLFEVGTDATAKTVVADAPAVEPPVVPQEPPKKKKTLIDLFNGADAAPATPDPVEQVQAPKPAVPAAKITAPKPAQDVQVASASGFVAQLASFRSKAEATAEFSRLRAKHGSIFQGVSPLISEGDVGGSTRFRLNIGGLDSKTAADAFCSKLFASGERDCLVRRK